MLHLYFLVRGKQLPSEEDIQIILSEYQTRYGDIEMLGSQFCDPLPKEPDADVVATCLLVCKNNGISFDSNTDEISYSVDILAGERIGVCRITVNK